MGDGTSNLERLAAWKNNILLGGLGDLMRTCIVLGRLSYGFRPSRSPKHMQSYRRRKQMPKEFSGKDCP
jgi:hypothetical protein